MFKFTYITNVKFISNKILFRCLMNSIQLIDLFLLLTIGFRLFSGKSFK